jgi:hypothetical protein
MSYKYKISLTLKLLINPEIGFAEPFTWIKNEILN